MIYDLKKLQHIHIRKCGGNVHMGRLGKLKLTLERQMDASAIVKLTEQILNDLIFLKMFFKQDKGIGNVPTPLFLTFPTSWEVKYVK